MIKFNIFKLNLKMGNWLKNIFNIKSYYKYFNEVLKNILAIYVRCISTN